MTAFREILRQAVENTPGAIGGSFADSQGEMVDSYTARYDSHDWAVLTAHFGVLLSLVESFFRAWHYGGPEYFITRHTQFEILVHTVEGGYYAIVATRRPIADATSEDRDDRADDATLLTLGRVREAVRALKKEMA